MSNSFAIGALVAALALVGSPAMAARQHQITADDVAQFKVGVATYADVIAKLGKPMSSSVLSNGTRVSVYLEIHTKVKGATFIPIVGLFAGGATGQTSIATFTFGPDGLLQSSSATNTDVDCSVGIISAGCDGGSSAPPSARTPSRAAAVAPPP